MTGTLTGLVTDTGGIPQMGAAVLLFNRYERLLARAITDERGRFGFDSLSPDTYSVRVVLASFVPAIKRQISVQPGMRSFLAISLSSVLSSVELVYMAPGDNPIMSDDWKWVLRSSPSTRPVLRIMPNIDIAGVPRKPLGKSAVFSGTRGVVKLSAGEGASWASAGTQADLGTAFAVATSLFGSNHLELSGNLGFAARSGTPTAGFRTSFSRDMGGTGRPELNLTVRQVFMPGHAGTSLIEGRQRAMPDMKTLTLSTVDRRQVSESLELQYGATLESVSFVERLNYFSPFAKASWKGNSLGLIELAFSSGALPAELVMGEDASGSELSQDLAALSVLPRVSLLGGTARVQRTQNFEAGYRMVKGSRSLGLGAYRENVMNAAFTAVAPAGLLPSAELLPDLLSNSSIFNAGSFRRSGYLIDFVQELGENFSAGVSYGYEGGLISRGEASSAAAIRNSLGRAWRHGTQFRLKGLLRQSGTRFTTSYLFSDNSVFAPVHFSLTQRFLREPGLNVYLRQPIPTSSIFPVRMEASADLRNLLAQGYLPIATADGRRLLLIHSPRSVRGGLSFIF